MRNRSLISAIRLLINHPHVNDIAYHASRKRMGTSYEQTDALYVFHVLPVYLPASTYSTLVK